jgi:molecular chaperone DnaJ
LRLKGKGFPRLRNRSNGDQLVKIQIETPTKLSSSTKKLIESLGKDLGPVLKPLSKIDL